MIRCLLSFCLVIMFGSANAQTKLYDFTGGSPGFFALGNFAQQGTSLDKQVIFFDDIQIPTALLGLDADSIDITALTVGIRRLANAPATNVNLWYARVNDTATLYANLIITPPTNFATAALAANGGSDGSILLSFGDSINTFLRLPADTGSYAPNLTSFFFGVSFEDTTGNGIFLGQSDGASVNDVNALWRLNPSVAPNPVIPFGFNGVANSLYVTFFGKGLVLPVTFTLFDGKKTTTGARLNWQTANEQNNHGFDLERSADGKQFSRIAFVPSKAQNGNSTSRLDYTYDDNSIAAAGSFYRLKQIDYDGKYQYSKVVFIKADERLQFTLSGIYPNPANSMINLAIEAEEEGKVNLGIIDMTGRRLEQSQIVVPKGYSNQQININKLPAGMYRVILQNEEGKPVISKAFIKQ